MLRTVAVLFAVATFGLAQTPPPTPPVTEKPVTEKPAVEKPAVETPPAEKPAGGKQGSEVPPAPKAKPDATPEPVIEKPPADAPIPAGFNTQDIAAMRSAQAMLEAEKKLAEQIKAGKLKGLDQIVTFDELSSWPYEDGLKGMPKRVKDLDGKKVLMTGFMLPIDEVQNIKEFLLVQSLWSCCYGQPPDINGIVRVVMPKGKTTDYFFDPLKIVGTLKIEATMMDGYCVDIYQLRLLSLETIK